MKRILEKKDDDLESYDQHQQKQLRFASETSQQQSAHPQQKATRTGPLSSALKVYKRKSKAASDIIESQTLFQDSVTKDYQQPPHQHIEQSKRHQHHKKKASTHESNHVPFNATGHHKEVITFDELKQAVPDLMLLGLTKKQRKKVRQFLNRQQADEGEDSMVQSTHQSNHVPYNETGHHKQQITMEQLQQILPNVKVLGLKRTMKKSGSTSTFTEKAASMKTQKQKRTKTAAISASSSRKHSKKRKASHKPIYLVPKYISGMSKKSNHIPYNEEGYHWNEISLPDLVQANPSLKLVGFPSFDSPSDCRKLIKSLPRSKQRQLKKRRAQLRRRLKKLQMVLPKHMLTQRKNEQTKVTVDRKPNQSYEYIIRKPATCVEPSDALEEHPPGMLSFDYDPNAHDDSFAMESTQPSHVERFIGRSKFLKPLEVHQTRGLNKRMPRDIVRDEFDDPRHHVSWVDDVKHAIDLALTAPKSTRCPPPPQKRRQSPWKNEQVIAFPSQAANQSMDATTLPNRPQYVHHPMRNHHVQQLLHKDPVVQSLVADGKLAVPKVMEPAQHHYSFGDQYSKTKIKRDGKGAQFNFGSIDDDIEEIMEQQEGRRQQEIIREEQEFIEKYDGGKIAPKPQPLRASKNEVEGPTQPILAIRPGLKQRSSMMPSPIKYQQNYDPAHGPTMDHIGRSKILGNLKAHKAMHYQNTRQIAKLRRALESAYPPHAEIGMTELVESPRGISSRHTQFQPAHQAQSGGTPRAKSVTPVQVMPPQKKKKRVTIGAPTRPTSSAPIQARTIYPTKSQVSSTSKKPMAMKPQQQQQQQQQQQRSHTSEQQAMDELAETRAQLAKILTNDVIFSIDDMDLLSFLRNCQEIDRKTKRKIYWRMKKLQSSASHLDSPPRTMHANAPSFMPQPTQHRRQHQMQHHQHQQQHIPIHLQHGSTFESLLNPMASMIQTLFQPASTLNATPCYRCPSTGVQYASMLPLHNVVPIAVSSPLFQYMAHPTTPNITIGHHQSLPQMTNGGGAHLHPLRSQSAQPVKLPARGRTTQKSSAHHHEEQKD